MLGVGCKHLELEHWPHIHNKALQLKAMHRNRQRPETGLRWIPAVTLQRAHTAMHPPPPPTHAISTCTRLSFNSAEHGCDWAVDIWRWVQTRDETEVEIAGWDSRKCWHFLNSHSNKWQCNNHYGETIYAELRTLCSPDSAPWPLLISTVKSTFRLWWTTCDKLSTLCTAAAKMILSYSAAGLLIKLHVSGLLHHTLRQLKHSAAKKNKIKCDNI